MKQYYPEEYFSSKRGFATKLFCIAFVLFFGTLTLKAQNCTVNAGILNETICETDVLILQGNVPSPIIGPAEWSQVSGPSVNIVSPNSVNTVVTGYTGGNTYVFRYSATCGDGVYTYQDKTVVVMPITIADAGTDIASCPNSSGSLVITGNAPENSGETGQWNIVGSNDAGVVINFPNSPTSTITLPQTSCGTTTLRWTITGTEYAPGQFCETSSDITVTNYGGQTPISAGPDQTLGNCYTTTQSTDLAGSFGGCGLNGQSGTWEFVSGPNTPTISSPNGNLTSVGNLIEGTYVFRWTVTGPCVSGSDEVSITVPAATQDVTTLSGGNENIYFCDNTITQVTLEAQTPLYANETVEWTQIEGDPGAVIESPNNPTTLVTNISNSGDPYTFRYTLTNSVTGCVFTKDYIVHFSGPTRTIEANGGNNIHGACNETDFSIPLVTTGNGVNRYRIVSGPAASPLGPFPTSPSNVGSTLNISLTVSGTYIIQFARVPNGDLPVGCDYGFDTITIVVSGDPTPSNAGSNISLDCGVTSTQLAGVPPVVGISAWTQLSGPNQATITDNFDPETTVTGLVSGTYVFQYITKGEGARCGFSTANVEVYVSSSTLTPADAGADDTVCVEGTITLSANEPQAGEYGEWSQVSGPDTITFSDINNPNAVASGFTTASSAYVLRWTIGYSNPGSAGCSAPVFDDVEISTNTDNAPTTAIAGADACYPSGTTDVPLSANDPTILEQGTWTVSPAVGVTFDDENDPNTIAHVPANGTYTFTWGIQRIIPLCNASTDDLVVTVADTPLADAGPDQEVCDDTVIMAATLSSGAQGTWTRVSGPGSYTISNVNDPNATFTFTYSGFYTFRWTVDAEVCATNFDDVDLTVNVPVGTVDAGPDQDICAGDSTVLAGSSYDSFFETGQWSLLAGAPNVPTLADASDPNTSVTGLVAGTYTFSWTVSSKDYFLCPPVTDTMVIEVSPPADAGDDATYCDVTSVQLIGNDNSTGTWTQISGPASTITQSPANSYVANATVIPGNTYVFQYETDTFNFTSGGNCPGSTDTVQVEIFSGASVDPNAGPDQQLCIDDVAGTATMVGNAPPGDVTLAEWRWIYQPAGSVATIDNPTDENTTISNLTVEGLYILEWVFESASCRSLSDIVRINMYAAPSTADAGPDDTVACQQTYQTNAIAPTVGIGTWSFANPADDPSGGDVVIDNPNNPVTTLSNITTLGTYTLTWTVTNGPFTDPSLCEPSTDTVSITFNDDPPTQANAGTDQELCAVTQTNMAAVPLSTGLGTWTQTSGPNTANIASPNDPATLIFGMVAGIYEFTWTATTVNNDGCSSQDTMQVIIYEAPSAANAGPDQQIAQFSPVVMAATAPTVGTGRWTQVSGPTTVGFTTDTSPTTNVTGTVAGIYVLQWNVSNGTCSASVDQVTIEIVALADLELSKSVSPTTGNAGDVVTFTIEVFNNDVLGGSVDATSVAVKDIIPSGYTLVPGTASNGGVYNLGDNSLTWSGLTILNGDTLTLTFDATVNATGSYINTAQITALDQIDPDSTPNNDDGDQSEDDEDNATINVEVADLSLQKSVTPGTVSVGENVVFTIQVDNAGPDNATGVTVSDQLPSGYTYVSDNGGGAYNSSTGIWTIGTINNGASASLQITATVTAIANYSNTTEVETADQSDPDSTPGNGLTEDDLDTATINLQQADLELVKNVSSTLVNEGDTVTFTLTFFNNGPGDATGIEVEDYLPNGYTLVPGSVSNGGLYQIANSTISWTGLSLANGGSLNLTFDAIAVAGGNHFNTAQITASDLPDPDSTPDNDDGDQSEDDESGIDVSIIITTPSADLSLTKSIVAGNTTPLVGTQVSFELIITNDGPDNATGVQITDLLPSGYDFVNFSSSAGLYDENTGLWNVGTVDSGTSESLIIDAIVLATGDYLNVAEVIASDLPDPDSTPNNDDGDQSEDDEDNAIVNPIAPIADLSITKAVSNTTPLVGSQVTFEVVVTNDGPQDASGVQVTDLLPNGYVYNLFTASSGTYNSTTGVWNIGTLTSGDSETLILAVTVNTTGDYENIAEVTASDLPDPDSTPNNGIDTEDDYASVTTTPIATAADLSVTKTVNNATPLVGTNITFTVTVSNDGPQDATGVIVIDLLPSGYIFVSSTATTGAYNNATGLWTVGSIATGSFETLQVTATINATGDYENIAEVTASDLPDPDSTPNNGIDSEDDYASVTTTPIATAADLSVTKTVNNATPLVGSQVTFEVVITNDGPQTATGVQVTDLLPDGYTYNSFSTTTGTYNTTTGLWNVGILANGESETLLVSATVNTTGNYENIAEVTASDLPDPDSTPNNGIDTEDDYASVTTIPTNAVADLSLNKTVLGSTTPLVGGQVTFSIAIRNMGPQDATGVQVTDLLPDGYNFVSYSATTGSYDSVTGVWDIGGMSNGASETLLITVTVNAIGDYFNIAQVSASDQDDPDSTPNNDDGDQSEDDEDNAFVTPVATAADLSVTKTVNNVTPLVGTNIIFTVTVSNDGPQDATGVTITDLLPSGYTFVSSTATTGAYNNATGLWTVGSIATGSFETLQITATINATGDYENIAEVTASDLPDPDSTPNNALDTEDDYASAITNPVAQSTDLSLTKTVNNATPLVGSQVTFEVIITNDGPQTATGVQITDLLTDGYSYNSFSATTGTYNSTTGLWNIGTLANGENETLLVIATVNATGDYENIAEVTASNLPDPDSTPNNGIDTEDDYASVTTTPIATAADLSLTKTVNNATPLVGTNVTFTITVSNDGPQDATGATVTDLLPTGYAFVSSTATTGAYNNTTGLWTVGSIDTGSLETLQVTATVNATGDYENIAEVTASDLPDPDSTPNNGIDTEDDYSSVTTAPVVQSADLSLTKTVNNATPLVGSQVTFEVVITNDGPQTATGVQVTDLLPDGYTYNSFSATTGTYNNTTGLWNVGSLANGESETLLVIATVNATGDYENIAEVTASNLPDPDSTPNNGIDTEDDYASVTTTPIATAADLSLTKTVNNATPLVGTNVTFTITVSNDGPQDATGATVTDLLPTGYAFVSSTATTGAYNNTTGLWTVGSIDTGSLETLQVTATVNATGDYENIAEVTASDLPDPDSTPNNGIDTEDDYSSVTTAPVVQSADLSLTKTVNNATPLVGSQVTFEIIITNDGPQTATGVQITDLLPDGYSYNSFSATTGTYNSTNGLWNIGTLANGESETLLVTATVNVTGDYENIAEVTASDLPDPDSTPNNAVDTEDDYASAITTPVAQSADLSLTKTVNNATPLVGSQVTFEVVITNDGPQTATGVQVTDLLPDGYTYNSFSATTGTYNNTTGLWNVGSLANGESETLLVMATVNTTGNYENIAEVTASNLPDPDSTPNNAVDTEDDYASVTTTPIATAADLSITKTVNNATPLVGSQVTFEVVITNDGPQTATGVQVTDLLPDGYTYNSFSTTTGTYNTTTGLWNVGILANGESETLLVSATVNTTGNYENIAEVTASDLPDPDSTPNNGIDTEDDYASVTTIPTNAVADLSLNKTVLGSTTPLVGGQVTFSIAIRNMGPQDATGVQVTDLLPDGYNFVSYSATTGSYDSVTGVWDIGGMSNGASETLLITVTVNAIGDYFNIAQVSASDQDDPDSTPNNDDGDQSEDDEDNAFVTPVATAADLSVTKTVNNVTPLVGTNIIFTVTVSNDGPQDATGVTITDLLPSGYTFVSSTATTGAYNNATGLWTVGSIATGSFETLQITATINATGDYENIAEVTASDLPDPDSTPNNALDTEDDYASAITNPVVQSADLSLTKTVNNATPFVGSQVTFEVVITNDGPQTATGVQVTDLLPDGYTYNSFSATTGTYNNTTGLWNVGSLANGESETLLVIATVNATGDYENIAEVTASNLPDPDSTPNNAVDTEDDYASVTTTPIATAADLSLTKTVNNATPLVGTNITFTVTVSNDGPQDATGVTVTDLLPTGYAFVSSTATTGAYNNTTGLWTVGSIATGSFETLQVTVTINATGDYENIAEVTASDLPDPDSTPNNGVDTEDDYASVVTAPVAQSADLSITKTVNNATPLVGTQVTFSIQITNAGPEDTSGVTVTDLLPTGYTYVSYTATAGAYDSVTGLWTIGNLDSGVFHTLQVTATVNGSGDYTNIAEVTSSNLPDPDSTPGNVIDTEDDYASVSTVPIPISADLSITKTVNHPTPLVGSGVVFTITVTNDGPQDATGVQVIDLLPSGYSFIVATTTSGIYNNLTGIWEVGTVASGVSETLLINASVLPSGDYLNVAEITASDTPDPDSTPGNGLDTEDDYASIATIPIAVSADLSITKTVNNPTPLVGSGVIFEIIVTNDGPQTATGVVVTDLLPSGYSYVVATTTAGIYNSTTGEWVVGTMPSGTSETLLINGIVQSTGDYLNIAEVTSSNEPDPDSTPGNGIDTEDDYASAITVPIAVSADLSITKTVNNPIPLVGNGVVFTISVTNDGPQTATGVVVTDLLPSGYAFVVATTTGGIYNSTIGEWSVGTLPSGTSETLLINAIVQPTGDYLNVAEITSSNEPDPDSTPGNGIDTEDDYASVTTVPIAVFADLSLTKTANNPTPIIGGGVTFEIIVTNDGPQTATGVVVTDLLPSGYSYVIASSTDGVYNSNTGEWLVSALPAGASQTLLINATVQSTGDYLNVAEITSSNEADPDSTPGNGVDTEDDYATAITTPIIPTADLELSKTIVGGNATPLVGSQIIFNIEVSNAGPASATGVVIEDVLPSGYTFVSYNATEGIYNSVNGLWTIGDPLISGASISLQITAVVNSTGDYLNIAEIFSSDVLDPDSTPNNGVTTEDDYGSVSTIPIPLVADLSLTKTVNNATPLVGSQVTFEVVITNDGPQTTTGVQVTDLLPDGYTYNSFTATAGTYTSATGLWNIGVLNNGQSVSLQVTATINATGDYENIAEVTASDLPDPDSTPANGIDTEDDYSNAVTTPVATAADLSITKTVNNATPLVGTNITFTVTVSNDGPQDATGVTVTDLLPTGYTFVSSTATIGAYNDVTGLWTVGSIATGSFETLQLTATVNTTGDYENIVEVTASDLPDPDSTPANGLDTEDDYASAVTTPIALAADLAITKTVNNAMPLVGSQVIFEIIVTNDGPQTATGVQVTDLLPEGYTYNSFTATAGTYAAVTGLWNIGVLTNGQSVSLQVTATVNATGGYENIAEVTTSDLPDPDSTPNNGIDNEDDYASAVTTPIATAADLSITKTVNNATPLVGSQVTFEVVITNDGPQTATGVQVTDLLPDGYSYNSFSATTGTYNNTTGLWNVGSLANGESETLLVTATVNISGNYLNIAEVTASDLPDPDSVSNNGIDTEDDYASATTTPVATAADLSVTKTVNNATPLVGSQVIFEVVITNDGPQTTTGVQVTDLLPDGYTYNSFSATTGTYNSTTGLWNVGTLGNGESETLQVTTTVNATGNYENIAEVTASNLPDPDSTPNNGTDTEDDYASVSVTPATVFADLSIAKNTIGGNTTYNVGDLVVFEVTVTNDGPGVATGVIVEDLLPQGFNFLSYTATSGVYSSSTGGWSTGAVLSGGTQTLLVYCTVNVPTGNAGEYTNIVEIMQSDVSDPDSTPGNGVTTEDDYASLDIIVEMADLSLEKTVSNITANVGETLVFTIQINNDGPTIATGVAVEDIVPVGYYNISNVSGGGIFNGYTITWQGLTVPLSGVTLTYEATVYDPTGLTDEDYKNIAQITASDQFDIDSTPDNDDGDQSEDDEDAAFIEVPRTDIGITKTVDNAEPAMNTLVSFTITAENISALEATNVIVSDALPNGYEFDSYSASTGDYNPLTGVWSISQIAGNSSETLVITAKVVDNSNYLNIARLESLDQVDYNPDNDEGSASVSPKCLDIYNEFSPNGDGDNDTFYIDCITNYPNNVLRIYSRWGDEVFSAKGYDNTWTGTSDGPEKTLPVGTYFYILDLGDGSEEIQGWLYLKR